MAPILKLVNAALVLCSVAVGGATCSSAPYATKINFASIDILDKDDGLQPHPLQPLKYGQPVYPATVDGDGLELGEAHLSYWEGAYYMYVATWGCGMNLAVYGRLPRDGDYPNPPVYPFADYGADGPCGIKTFKSPDLTNWKLIDFYNPNAGLTKPIVRYSNVTEQYVMYLGGGDKIRYATSKSPAGPWGELHNMTGPYLNHDFDIFVGPDGTHYILSDPFDDILRDPYEGLPVWNIWVQQLTPELTGTMENSAVLIRNNTDLLEQDFSFEASGAFYHDGYYYLTFGYTCQNCAGYIYYLYSDSPFGPYKDGGYLTKDGCGGQNKGANVLPTADGQVIVGGIMGYRTSPSNYVRNRGYKGYIWHADNQQAVSSTYFYPFEFNEDHTLKSYTCAPKVRIPLVANATAPDEPIPYQLDCRVRNWQNVVASYSPPKKGSKLQMSVFQRTDNLAPTTNAGPLLDGALVISVGFVDGRTQDFTWPASNISWAPEKVAMDVSGKEISSIVLSTNATNGCYGTMAMPKLSEGSIYGAQIYLQELRKQDKAELYVYQW